MPQRTPGKHLKPILKISSEPVHKPFRDLSVFVKFPYVVYPIFVTSKRGHPLRAFEFRSVNTLHLR